MARPTEKLTFFCQLCDKSIETNICQAHGIDFVTIKKVSAIEKKVQKISKKEEQRINGMLQLGEKETSTASGNEKLIATREQIKAKEAFLPVIPTDSEEDLKPVPASKIPGPDPVNSPDDPLRESIEKDLQDQLRDYREPVTDVSDYYEDYTAPATQKAPSRPKGTKVIIALSLLVMILISMVVAYFAINQQEPSPTTLYSQAESLYESQNYSEALQLYTQFAEAYPNDPLTPIVNEKINLITRQTTESEATEIDDQTRLQELMLKANIALQKQQYVKPKNDNAIAYINAVWRIDPAYQPAREMFNNIIHHYEALAEESLQKGNYNEAIIYYQTILEIKPNDADVISKIHSILTRKDEAAGQ